MNELLVACLCAEWCDTCRDYRPEFTQLGSEYPQHRFVWIDIEDQADLVPDIEIENFPTLLVANDGGILFAGTMQPHISQLRRLLITLDDNQIPQIGKLSAAELSAFRLLAAQLASD